MPYNIKSGDEKYIIAHEMAHLKRLDHIFKPLAFAFLCVYWFNPLMWLSYILFCKDTELACDEKVIKEFDIENKKSYSEALVNCSAENKSFAACPLAFSENGVKGRIVNVLSYKKPTLYVIIIAIIALIITAVCFLSNPTKLEINEGLDTVIKAQIAKENESEKTKEFFAVCGYEVLDVKNFSDITTVYAWVLYEEYSFNSDGFVNRVSYGTPAKISFKHNEENIAFVLREYFEPSSGANYESDIRKNFTLLSQYKIFERKIDFDKVKLQTENQARAHFGLKLKEGKEELDAETLSLIKEAENCFSVTVGSIISVSQNGDYLAMIFSIENTDSYGLCLFEKQFIFKNKWKAGGGIMPLTSGEMESYNIGTSKAEAVIVFCGVNLPVDATAYTYTHIGKKHIVPINNRLVLDLLVVPDCNDISATPTILNGRQGEIYTNIMDQTDFDIDGDGVTESCYLRMGPASGVLSFYLTITENGKEQYNNLFTPIDYHSVCFTEVDGKLKIEATQYTYYSNKNESVIRKLFDISFDGENIFLTNDEEKLLGKAQ